MVNILFSGDQIVTTEVTTAFLGRPHRRQIFHSPAPMTLTS